MEQHDLNDSRECKQFSYSIEEIEDLILAILLSPLVILEYFATLKYCFTLFIHAKIIYSNRSSCICY